MRIFFYLTDTKGDMPDNENIIRKIKELDNVMKLGNKRNIVDCVNALLEIENAQDVKDLNTGLKVQFKGETLLHIALKFTETLGSVKKYLAKNQDHLLEQRDSDDYYRGQTPLHVAIVKGNFSAVETILEIADKQTTQELLGICADGEKFKNTVLIGQLPFSVAALVCTNKDFKIIDYLLEKVEIWKQNKAGDTVFHSLIRYADIYPEKMQHIRPTFEHIWSEVFSNYISESESALENQIDSDFWKQMENKSGLTPLHLSAKLGVSEIFDLIIDTQNVYCFKNFQDGLFDIKKYDVTEFDRLISYTDPDNGSTERENVPQDENKQKNNIKRQITILESLFDSKCSYKEAFQILNHQLVEFILKQKWYAYRWILAFWLLVHFIYILSLTISTMEKSRLFFCFQHGASNCEVGESSKALVVINLLVGITYFIFAISCILKLYGRCKNEKQYINFRLILHNIDYIICLLFISVGVLLESVLIYLKMHWDYHLVLALMSGWYFLLYFAPFNKSLVSFTFMIKSGFFEDFIPFAVVFLCLLSSFSAIMDMLFRGTGVDEFATFGSSFLTMFNLGVGLNDLGVLNQSRIPWLAYTVFVVYVILSFIHLFNALVAVMSQTFSDVHKDRDSYRKYNQLRMIELFEDIFLTRKIVKFLFFLNWAKHWVQEDDDPDENERSQKQHSGINDNMITKQEKSKSPKEQNTNKRYYSILQLLNDAKFYKHKEVKERHRLKRFVNALFTRPNKHNKTHSERDITFYRLDKSSQYPESSSH